MKFALIGPAFALATACAAQTQPESYAAYSPGAQYTDACEIRETRTANGLRLQAVAHADYDLRADYDFVITAYSAGGSSDITQGGPVDLTAGQSATVSSAEIPRSRYRATLTLTDADGEICHRVRGS